VRILTTVGRWLAVILAWLATAALGLVDIQFARASAISVTLALNFGTYGIAAVDKWLLLPLGLLWMAGVLYAQYRYGEAGHVGFHLLASRWLRITLVQVAIMLAAFVVQILT
jgi:hypothetical protein